MILKNSVKAAGGVVYSFFYYYLISISIYIDIGVWIISLGGGGSLKFTLEMQKISDSKSQIWVE